jgi:3-dehydroquinate dehydratase II
LKKKSKRSAAILRILIANGVNLDLLGTRESEWYGKVTVDEIETDIRAHAAALCEQFGWTIELHFLTTNSEHELFSAVARGWSGLVINPGAWTHTSLALADRLTALKVPYVEVHLSNLARREEFRQRSFTAPGAAGVVYGLGRDSYIAGLTGLVGILTRR